MEIFKLFSSVAESGPDPEKQREKFVVTDEYFQRVTRALVMHLRQHEETVAQGK